MNGAFNLRLINNNFNDIEEINGFSKEELIDIKRKLTKLNLDKADQTEIEGYLSEKFSSEIIEFYSNYLNEIKTFIFENLLSTTDSQNRINFNHFPLKSGIKNEIKKIYNNLLNLKVNAQNTKRFLKNSAFLDELLITIQDIMKEYQDLTSQLNVPENRVTDIYDNYAYIWIEINKLKNQYFKINNLTEDLTNWDEFQGFYECIRNNIIESTKKKERKKKNFIITTHFNDIYSYFSKLKGENPDIYTDLIAFLYNINLIEEFKEKIEDLDEYVNILDRKEIKNRIKSLMNPIIKKLIEDKIKGTLNEIIELDKTSRLGDQKKDINIKRVLEQKIGTYLPQIIDYYLKGLENKYQAAISDLKGYDEFKNVAKFYSEKIDILNSQVEEIENYFANYTLILKPYEDIINKHKKTLSNITSEIERRKNEYLFYLKTIRKERLRDNIRTFIFEKITEVNTLMSKYQDETSLIVREEFPQLKKMQNILSEYKVNIQKIKDEVYQKIDSFKEKDIDIYQIIKQWEDNFTLKKQQLSFLLSLLINKLFKSFKDMIEEEKLLYEHITDITNQNENYDNLPLNFAISNLLVDKLTEDELDERINEIHSKIENLNKEIELYRAELSNLKRTLANKVKIREGITSDDIQCGVCRKKFDFSKDKIIKCPFCGAVFHYLCVASWLSKHNACPSCQNTFLDPNAGIYSDQE